MGLTRKIFSVSTAGLIDFRSAKDRTAAYSRGTRKEARKQTDLMRSQAKAQEKHDAEMLAAAQLTQAAAPTAPPAGFYNDPAGQQLLRWWDGVHWTDVTQPLP